MTVAEFIAEMEKIVELDPGSIGIDQPLKDVPGWDSVAMIGVIALVDEKMGRELSAPSLVSCKTVNDLVKLALGPLG